MFKSYSALTLLPLGDVTTSGWLREQLARCRDGMGGHLDELEPRMIGTPYTTKETEPTWGEARKAGWGAEISGNYWTGLVELAYALNDDGLKAKAGKWVDEVLSYQRPDGYLGTYTESDDMYDDYNAWGTNCGMTALLEYYSATRRADVLEAVHRCLLWFCEHWKGDRKTRYCGVSLTECMSKCYLLTGDRRLLDFCTDYYDFLRSNELFANSLESMLSDELHYNSNHGAGYVNHIGQPADVYAACGDRRYLSAAVNAYNKVKAKMIQKTGGVTCESEYLAPLGSNVETEYCGYAMYAKSLRELAAATGDPSYGDELERVFFNGAQGARKKDERAIEYLSSPNQIFATDNSSYADGPHQVYAPCVPVACCTVMSVRILPEFVRSLAMVGSDGGLYFPAYAPADVRFGALDIRIDTEYPFRDTVGFDISAAQPAEATLNFRIPGWCGGASLAVNGEVLDNDCPAGAYVPLKRVWHSGDRVTLRLPMKVKIGAVDDSDRGHLFPLEIEYGPLLFSLPIRENWQPYPGSPVTPLPQGWHWYNVTPEIPRSSYDVYDDMGARKDLISYNVALDEDLSADDIHVNLHGGGGYVWEQPRVTLTLPAYKAPYSYPPYPYKTFEPYCENGYAHVTEKLSIELVPYGCTALRITYFPRAGLKK